MNWPAGMWIVIFTALFMLIVTVNVCETKVELRPTQQHGPHQ